MSEHDLSTFDDPGLKVALRRALAAEKAPPSLRAQVEELLAQGDFEASPEMKPLRPFWRHPVVSLAWAAAILFCVGLAAWHFEGGLHRGQIATATAALPEVFARDLVATHDHCSAGADHHILKGVPDDDFRLMTQKLREQLGFPALAAAAGDGWNFCGASGMCMVGQAHSAHLLFKQNGESLSIFSVAVGSESWPDNRRPAEGERFANSEAGHPIVSWIHDDTVYSVVGASPDKSLKVQDIAPIADHLRVALSGEGETGPQRVTVAAR